MSEDNSNIMDEIFQLRLMYTIRENMQRYFRGEKIRQMPEGQPSQLTSDNIMSAYFALLKKVKSEQETEKTEQRLVNYIYQEVNKIEYKIDYESFHSTDKKEDKNRKKNIEKVAKNNNTIKRLEKEIQQEIICRRNANKTTISQDAKPISVSIVKNDKGKEDFVVKFDENDQLLIIPIYKNKKGNYGSYYTLSGDIKGIGNVTYKELKEKGEISLKQQTTQNIGKKYTLSSYKKLSSVKDEKLIEREIDFINTLTASDQKRFIAEALAKREKFFQIKDKALQEVVKYTDKLKNMDLSEDPEKVNKYSDLIKKLFSIPGAIVKTKSEMNGKQNETEYDVKDNFVSNYMASNDAFWAYFSEKINNYRNQSRFENQMQHFVERKFKVAGETIDFKQVIDDILSSPDNKLEEKTREGFKKIQSVGNPPLPEKLTAEIFTYCVFLRGLSKPSTEKFNKMNKILNDFGLNIAFNQLEVTQIPDIEITEASQQYQKDRKTFEETKKYNAHKDREKKFKEYAKNNDIKDIKGHSVHHFIPLKYNSFIDYNTNQEANYIITARQNLWNIDMHNFVHRFDTEGNFLLKLEDNNFEYRDFNGTRNLYRLNKHKKIYIVAPVLQIKRNGKYQNALTIADNKNNNGFYISTDKDENIISIPSYCKSSQTLKEDTHLVSKNKQKGRHI